MADNPFSDADIKYAVVNYATATHHEVVAAVAGKKIRVVFAGFHAGNVAVTLESFDGDSTYTALTGAMNLNASPGIWTPNEYGWVETIAGEALTMLLSGAVQVSGVVGYVEVTG